MMFPGWDLVLVLHDPTLLSHGHTLRFRMVINLHLVAHLNVLVLSLFELALGVSIQLVIGFVLEVNTAILGHLVFLDDDGAVQLAFNFHAAVDSGVGNAGLFGKFIGAIFLFVGDLIGLRLLGWEFGRGRGLGVPVIVIVSMGVW